MVDNRNAWEKYGVIVGIMGLAIGSILSGIALIQSNYVNQKSIELAQASLALENTTSNYQTTIIPYYVSGFIDHDIRLDYNGGLSYGIGFLNVSLIVVTPHAAVLNFSKVTTLYFVAQKVAYSMPVGNTLEWINPANSTVEYYPFINGNDVVTPQSLVAFVQPGITQVNFSIPLRAEFYLNSDWLSELNSTGGKIVPQNKIDEEFIAAGSAYINLGKVESQIDFLDLQTLIHNSESITSTVEVTTFIEWL